MTVECIKTAFVSLILFCCIFASHETFAGVEMESMKIFKGLGFSVNIDDEITVHSERPIEDFEIYTFYFKGKEILFAYSGNAPDFPMWAPQSEEPTRYQLGDLPIECFEWQNKKKEYFKECLIKLSTKLEFPMYLHYWYTRQVYPNKSRADKLIDSTLKLNAK